MKKILLIHGWNYRNYTSQTKETDAWHNRKEMVEELEKDYEVYKINLPGFCGQEEPTQSWTLDDYSNFIKKFLEENNLTVDYILGYSFGGAVAITYYLKYGKDESIILVSPAIVRNDDKSKKFIKTPKVFDKLRNILRDFYLIHIVKTNEMVYGTKFLRETYQKIVRVDLRNQVVKIPSDKLLIIYGDKDRMVDPESVINYLNTEYKEIVQIIEGGGHNIGGTHPKQLVKTIKDNIRQ